MLQMQVRQIATAATGWVELKIDRFMMDSASVVVYNLAGILTKHPHTGNGKSIQPIAPFLNDTSSSNVN